MNNNSIILRSSNANDTIMPGNIVICAKDVLSKQENVTTAQALFDVFRIQYKLDNKVMKSPVNKIDEPLRVLVGFLEPFLGPICKETHIAPHTVCAAASVYKQMFFAQMRNTGFCSRCEIEICPCINCLGKTSQFIVNVNRKKQEKKQHQQQQQRPLDPCRHNLYFSALGLVHVFAEKNFSVADVCKAMLKIDLQNQVILYLERFIRQLQEIKIMKSHSPLFGINNSPLRVSDVGVGFGSHLGLGLGLGLGSGLGSGLGLGLGLNLGGNINL